jgi:acylphosphatase
MAGMGAATQTAQLVDRIRCRVVVRGRVQGVWFRASVAEAARGCGVDGWVRNRSDGAVEAAFEGRPEVVERLVEYCRHGPPGAQVMRVDTHIEPLHGETIFTIA